MADKRSISWKRRVLAAFGLLAVLCAIVSFLALNNLNFDRRAPFGAWQEAMGRNPLPADGNTSSPDIISHRGSVHNGIPENTIEAIEQAENAEVDWIEIDIRKTSDDKLAVFHDADIETDEGPFRLRDHELSDLKKHCPFVPKLGEVFEHFAGRDVRFVLDVKDEGIREWLMPLVETHCTPDQVIIAGGYAVLQEYKGSKYQLGYIVRFSEEWNAIRFLFSHAFVLKRCAELKCDYLILPDVFLNQSLLDAPELDEIAVWAYGSEEEDDLRRNVRRGVSGVIVDDPETATKAFLVSHETPPGQEH